MLDGSWKGPRSLFGNQRRVEWVRAGGLTTNEISWEGDLFTESLLRFRWILLKPQVQAVSEPGLLHRFKTNLSGSDKMPFSQPRIFGTEMGLSIQQVYMCLARREIDSRYLTGYSEDHGALWNLPWALGVRQSMGCNECGTGRG